MKKKRLGRKLLGFLLTLAMVVGLVPGMSLTALADGTTYSPASEYTDYGTLNSNDITVQIEGVKIGDTIVDWYVIGYDSTDKTVTLLSKQVFAYKLFNSDRNKGNHYVGSDIEAYVKGLIGDGQPLAGIKDALADINGKVTGDPSTISGAVPYLLSCAEANALSDTKRSQAIEQWWLRSPGGTESRAAQVNGGSVDGDGNPVDSSYAVRPALQLDLSKVVFDSTNNSFSLKPHEHNDITFQAWDNSTSLPTEAGNYYLGCDVTLQGDYNNENNPAVWTVPSGTTNLCLNGHSISITDKWSRLEVPNGSTLNLYDDGETGTVIQTDQDSVVSLFKINGGQLNLYSGTLSGALTVYNESGTFNMYGGNVQGSSSVYVENGVFNLEAGQIIATVQGVGVGDSGRFTMSGGKITGSSSYQPAVGVSGIFTMSGGEICNNNCPSNEWGTVSVDGTFNMEGGSIYGNTAKRGGGIGVVGNGTFNLTGGSIYGNTAENGGGVYAYVSSDEYYKPHVNITGGSITGNNATSWGGGVYGAENVYLSDSPQIYDNYLNGELSESVYEKGDAGANNNLCITNSEYEDNIDYFNVNGELSSDSRVGINLPAEKLDAATFPLVISRGFGKKIEDEDGESSYDWYYNGEPGQYFFFDRDGYTLTEKEVEYDRGQKISEVAVGLNEVYYTEDAPHETYDYNVISGGSGDQNWSTKKTDQVIFEDTTITGNIQIKSSTDVTRIIYGDYSEGADLTVNGSIYSDALKDGDGSGNLRVCGSLDEYCKLKVVSQTEDTPAINVKNISVYGATLELAGPEGGSALRSDAYISSPYTFIYESEDGINYTYHPYTSGSTTPIGSLKRYVKINNTEPEWVAEVTSGDDTSKYVDFNEAIAAWSATSGSTLKLLKDITTSGTITVTGGTAEAPLVLDLNGQGIMYTGNGKSPVITVDNGGVFNLNDSDTTKKHYITLTSGRGTAVSDANSDGAIKVTGGYITGGTGFKDGSTLRGGGVLVKNGTFTISGGTIVGNNAKDGGGVSVAYNSNFTMNGGSIYYNTASENAGGVFASGVTGSNKASVIINEGNIVKNTAQLGGGVCIGNLGAFTMNGGKIEGNTASIAGGGVVQNGNEYEFAVNGGSITENKAMSLAGGIACVGPFNLSGGVIITGNKVGDEDENVYLIEDGEITLTGALSDTASIGVSMQTPGVFTSSTGDIKAKDYRSRFFSDNSEYIVKVDGNELKLSTHEHRFTYSAEDGTITATCTDHNGCPLADNDYKATLTISAIGGTYDGTTSYEATVTDENSIKGDAVVNYYKATDSDERGDALSPLTTAPTNAGRYWAEITLGTGEDAKTAHVVYTIEKAAETAPAADTNQLNINYSDETISAKPGYEVASDDNGTDITNFSSILDEATPTVYIRKAASNDNHAPSEWVPVTLSSRPPAPTGLGSTNAADGASKDGTITDVNDTMEYSADGTNWTSVNGTTITGLKAGTYKVRVRATDTTTPHGRAADVTVGSNYKALDDSVSVIIKKGDSAIGDTVPVVDDVLTADCEASNIVYQWYRGGEPIDGATEGTYTLTKNDVGKAIAVQAIQTKKADGTNYGENDRPKKMSEFTEAVVKKDGPAAPESAQAAEFVPDYSAETFTIGEGYEVSSTDDEDGIITDKSLTDVIDGTRKIYIRVKETEDTKAGAWLEVTLSERPAAPTELGSTNATDGASKDGTITGVNDTMEYSADGTNWTAVNGITITGLKAGTYKVRVKATEDKPAGEIAEVTVGSRKLTLTDRQKPTEKTNLKYNGSAQALLDAPADGLPDGAVEIIYAIGENIDTAPEPDADGTPDDQKRWLTSIPTATDAGTYYVWYKVVGDENHNDVEPECIKVTIAEEKKQDEPVKPETPAKTVDMYRLYNPNSGEHFYTANKAERDMLTELGWRYEGIGWKAPEKSNTPVYRLYNPNAGDHHYTVSVNERDWLVSLGWRYEGIGWYSDDSKSVPLYRQYNPNEITGTHNYTTNKAENDWLVSLGWRGEGIGWYGVK